MKSLLFFVTLFLSAHLSFGQAYTPMPADSAVWRYRFYNIDYVTQVIDCIIFLNGADTTAPAAIGGRTYHKLFSRGRIITVPNDSLPPITSVVATYPDTYYGAIRDSGRQVYLLTLAGEDILFDFNVIIGDSIPAYSGKDKVIAIDSLLIGGVYHRRFLTNDSAYYAIEGIGSNQGLIPDLNDGSDQVRFFCFSDTGVVYEPDNSVVCTTVYPPGYESVPDVASAQRGAVSLFPVPAFDILHITTHQPIALPATICNSIGQRIWSGTISGAQDIIVSSWPRGFYYIQFSSLITGNNAERILLE